MASPALHIEFYLPDEKAVLEKQKISLQANQWLSTSY